MNLVSRPPGASSPPALPHRAAIATTCLSGALDEKLTCIAAAGFTGVELFEADVLHYPGTREEVRAMCAKLGLKIEAYGPFWGFEGGEEVRRKLEMLEGMLRRMMELGADVLIMGSNASPACVGFFFSPVRRCARVAYACRSEIKRGSWRI
jgi:sugar phosphate isomerase/epimerase